MVLDATSDEEPLVPLGRIVDRVALVAHGRGLIVTPLPFSIYRN